MGRGKSASVTAEFLKEQEERIAIELEKYLVDGKFTLDLPALMTAVGGPPDLVTSSRFRGDKASRFLDGIITGEDPAGHDNTVTIGAAAEQLHKPLAQWLMSARTYHMTDQDKADIQKVIDLFQDQGKDLPTTSYVSRNDTLQTVLNESKIHRYDLTRVADPEISRRYAYAVSELGALLKPHVDVLQNVFQGRHVNRRKRAVYTALEQKSEQMSKAKLNKVEAYKEFSVILSQVQNAVQSIAKILVQQPPLASLTCDIDFLNKQALTPDDRKNLQVD